jgi:hypothetical protein
LIKLVVISHLTIITFVFFVYSCMHANSLFIVMQSFRQMHVCIAN